MKISQRVVAILVILAVFIYRGVGLDVAAQPGSLPNEDVSANAVGWLTSNGDLMALTIRPHGAEEFVAIVDCKTRSMAAYGLRQDKNEWVLKSVRNIEADLKMDSWNGTPPKPSEIRKMLILRGEQ